MRALALVLSELPLEHLIGCVLLELPLELPLEHLFVSATWSSPWSPFGAPIRTCSREAPPEPTLDLLSVHAHVERPRSLLWTTYLHMLSWSAFRSPLWSTVPRTIFWSTPGVPLGTPLSVSRIASS